MTIIMSLYVWRIFQNIFQLSLIAQEFAWESNHELSNAVLAQYHIVKIRIAACRLIYVKYNKDKFYFIEQILESDMTDSSK